MQDNKMQDNKMQDNTMQDIWMQDNTMQGNPGGFETVWKMGNDLEKSRQFIRFFCYMRKIFPDKPKKFRVAMLPCYPGFCTSGRQNKGIQLLLNTRVAFQIVPGILWFNHIRKNS